MWEDFMATWQQVCKRVDRLSNQIQCGSKREIALVIGQVQESLEDMVWEAKELARLNVDAPS
jgi:hypothetical protein